MGVFCCNKVMSEKSLGELNLGSTEIQQQSEEMGVRLGRSKTMTKKEAKKIFIPKTETDAVLITPAQFVLETHGVLTNSYQFVKQLGQGSYGTVYKALHKRTKEIRAIKIIKRDSVLKEQETELFSEIKVLKDMDHHSIMRIYEFSSDSLHYYLVSEYISGGELFDEIVKRKVLNEKDAAYIMRQILSAITYCHSKGIMHRDLKPENILIDNIHESGKINIKVIDFGTALYFSPASKFKETMGTPYYIAPEVLKGNYTEKCDVWSAGVILFILLSGNAPFNGKTDEDILSSVISGKFSFNSRVWSSVSESAKELITMMLEYNPEKRISAAEAYKHRWLQSKEFISLSPEKTQEFVNNMTKFYSKYKLQQAAMMFIVSQLMSNKEKESLRQIFMALDKNGDGALTYEELLEGYSKLYGNKERAIGEVNDLMSYADVDNNGIIDYSEFLLAVGNKKQLLSKANVKQAFDMFDIDGSGSISPDEIKTILGLGRRFSEDIWKEIIKEADMNDDGEISYEEFEAMMSKFIG